MEAIEEIIRQMRVMESRYEGRKASDTYISVYLRPGGFLRDIMREASLRRVEITAVRLDHRLCRWFG
ncbi:MAG: hypothetical protein HFH59_17475 [Lachnospiraceae bacterium]|nr:hypothetical protein [Lachnospiraceae bacterium]